MSVTPKIYAFWSVSFLIIPTDEWGCRTQAALASLSGSLANILDDNKQSIKWYRVRFFYSRVAHEVRDGQNEMTRAVGQVSPVGFLQWEFLQTHAQGIQLVQYIHSAFDLLIHQFRFAVNRSAHACRAKQTSETSWARSGIPGYPCCHLGRSRCPVNSVPRQFHVHRIEYRGMI